MALLSIVVLVTCHTLAAGHQHIHHGDRIATAARLGRDMLEEIASRAYRDLDTPTNFGLEAGETTRAHFDDADDYHGYSEPAGSLCDFAGNAYPVHDEGFSRSMTVTATTHAVAELGRSFPGVSVVVTVRAGSGEQWEFKRFIPEPGR